MLAIVKERYGLYGVETYQLMLSSIEKEKIENIEYNKETREFTLIGSSHITKPALKALFKENYYLGHQPVVLDQVDTRGNKKVRFVSILDHECWL